MAAAEPRGASTRDRIVDEAFSLFAELGFHAVSVRDIAAAVGVRDASLYNHFPGKQAIFDAILERELARLRDMFAPRGIMFSIEDDASGYDPSDAAALETRVLESIRPFFEDERLHRLRRLLVVSQFENEEAACAYRLVFIERPMALQRTVFEHLMATGAFERGDALQMAVEFQGPVFLMLHANAAWETARPRIAALLASFSQRYRATGGNEKANDERTAR